MDFSDSESVDKAMKKNGTSVQGNVLFVVLTHARDGEGHTDTYIYIYIYICICVSLPITSMCQDYEENIALHGRAILLHGLVDTFGV